MFLQTLDVPDFEISDPDQMLIRLYEFPSVMFPFETIRLRFIERFMVGWMENKRPH
jgi:hypothetical protein